jgi:transcriptional regulator with XRE-family HTH domain
MALENMQVRLNGSMDSLASRAKAARNFAKMTQVQAAKASGVKQSDISKIERGDTARSAGLLALARAYKVNPYWLDTGEGQMDLAENGQTPDQPAAAAGAPERAPGGKEQLIDALAVIADALVKTDKVTRAAIAPLLSSLGEDPAQTSPISHGIAFLLYTLAPGHKPADDETKKGAGPDMTFVPTVNNNGQGHSAEEEQERRRRAGGVSGGDAGKR